MNNLFKRLQKLEQDDSAILIYSAEQTDPATGDLLLYDRRREPGKLVGRVPAQDIARHRQRRIVIERHF